MHEFTSQVYNWRIAAAMTHKLCDDQTQPKRFAKGQQAVRKAQDGKNKLPLLGQEETAEDKTREHVDIHPDKQPRAFKLHKPTAFHQQHFFKVCYIFFHVG